MFSSGHRTLYIGVHVPLGRRSHRRHRHHGHRHRKRSKERDSSADDGRESPSHSKYQRRTLKLSWTWLIDFLNKRRMWLKIFLPAANLLSLSTSSVPFAVADTPAQRVQFLLGTEDGDEEHIPHALFTELDEICLREGEDAEWKETARYAAAVGHMGWVWPAAAFFLCCTWDFDPVSIWLQAIIKGLLLWRHTPRGVHVLIHTTLYFIAFITSTQIVHIIQHQHLALITYTILNNHHNALFSFS